MKARIDGLKLYFYDFNPIEARKLKDTLTWRGKESTWDPTTRKYIETDIVESALFYDDDVNINLDGRVIIGAPYTLWGLYDILKERIPFDVVNFHDYYTPNPVDISLIHKDIFNSNPDYPFQFLDFQLHAIKKAHLFNRGSFLIATGGGKTEIILGILATMTYRRALIVMPSVALAQQFIERALLRGFQRSDIGLVGGGSQEHSERIVVAVMNSVNNTCNAGGAELEAMIKDLDMLIFDEAHHIGCDSYQSILMHVEPKHIYFFSGTMLQGTHPLDSARDSLVYGLAGRPLMTVGQVYLRQIGLLAEPQICVMGVPGLTKFRGGYNKVYEQYVVRNFARNNMIVEIINKSRTFGFPVLVLVQRKEHAETLLKLLHEPDCMAVYGGSSGVIWESGGLTEIPIDYDNVRARVAAGVVKCVIATQCFTPDTRISLMNGTEVPIVDLVGLREFYVYSRDLSTGEIVPGRAHSCHKTGDKVPVLKITLDNGEVIRCTYNNPILLKSGRYRDAERLSVGDSLSPLYRCSDSKGYEELLQKDGSWQKTHRMTYQYKYGKPLHKMETGHHKDFNKRNNEPKNILAINPQFHIKFHSSRTSKHMRFLGSIGKHPYQNPVVQRKALDTKKKSGVFDNWLLRHPMKSSTSRLSMVQSNIDNGHNARLSERQKINNCMSLPDVRSRMTATKLANGDFDRWNTHNSGRKGNHTRWHKNTPYETCPKCNPIDANHKVVSIEPDGYSDVYDFTVDTHHNFALSAGVFVHNTFDEGVDIPTVGVVIMAGAGRSRIKFFQRIGRGVRKKVIVNKVYIFDFLDNAHVFLRSQSYARVEMYKELEAPMYSDRHTVFNAMLAHSIEVGNIKI
jgi:superfamily II DNA or RNA helicase